MLQLIQACEACTGTLGAILWWSCCRRSWWKMVMILPILCNSEPINRAAACYSSAATADFLAKQRTTGTCSRRGWTFFFWLCHKQQRSGCNVAKSSLSKFHFAFQLWLVPLVGLGLLFITYYCLKCIPFFRGFSSPLLLQTASKSAVFKWWHNNDYDCAFQCCPVCQGACAYQLMRVLRSIFRV